MSMKGKSHTEKTKVLISKNHADFSGKNNLFFKKKHTDRGKALQSEAHKGEKHRAKVLEWLKDNDVRKYEIVVDILANMCYPEV